MKDATRDAAPAFTVNPPSAVSGVDDSGKFHKVSMSADGTVIAAATWDRNVRTYNASSTALDTFHFSTTADHYVQAIALDDSGTRVLAGNGQGHVIGYRLSDGTRGSRYLESRDRTQSIFTVALSGDASHAVATDSGDHVQVIPEGTVTNFLAEGGPTTTTRSLWSTGRVGAWSQGVSITRHGRLVATGSHGGGEVRLWLGHADDDVILRTMATGSTSRAVALSRDGRFVLSGHDDGEVILWILGRRPYFPPDS